MDEKLLKALYFFEHRLIPEYFFDEEINFVLTLSSKPEILFKIFNDICEKEEIENNYSEDDFSCKLYKLDEDGEWFGMIIDLPHPVEMPLCYNIYLFLDVNSERKGCFTLEYHKSEKQEPTEKELGCLCSWTKEKAHRNYAFFGLVNGETDFFIEAFKMHLQNNHGEQVKHD